MPNVVFPYGVALREGGRIDVFPAAEVRFPSPDGKWISLLLIVDSGASISALPINDARPLGINAATGTPMVVAGIAGKPVRGWRHELHVRLGPERLRLPVVLLDDATAPRVLGRAGLFERTTVVFEESSRRSGFLGRHTKGACTVRRVLDQAASSR